MMASYDDRRLLNLLRWYLLDKTSADQVRSDTIAPYMLRRYRAAGERIDATSDKASWHSARIALAGAAHPPWERGCCGER